MDIRRALPADLPAVAAIYAREAREGHATFDLEPRPMELWEERLAASGPRDHFLVAEHEGAVAGYATSSPFRPKPAYSHTRETTVYVAPGHQGRGVGRRLYDALLARLTDDGVHLVVAAVALPNDASLALHRACGFEEVGVMREVGRKHDRWIDVAWMQRVVG
ncbi:GNAT family N-acetyltransferase [Nocardioides sp. zg-1228]|uniref:GNAT family N-acetyltransferase n=1 Tax=Nocardioides sp. zg-1228 TaxID=2763008 RepID=UPI00197E2BE1|nr:GNAT family N-acetyltransferase [Nocardioides sp. zg-1228]QSF59136.1 N-acetyltransferase [Nocardioides sp. zg-1228]